MRTKSILAAAAAVCALAAVSPAQALCLAEPETASSHFVANNAAQALCLQQELAATTSQMAEEARWREELANAQLQLRLRLEQQLRQPAWPN